MKKTVLYLAEAAVIAALYAALTYVMGEFSSMAIQVRLSEAMCVLPAFFSSSVPGLFVGCLVANLLNGSVIDIIFGSLTTLVAAVLGRIIQKKIGKLQFILVPLPAVILNALVIPLVLIYGYGITEFMGATSFLSLYGLLALSIGIGEFISCYVFGIPLYFAVKKVLGSIRKIEK